MGDPPPDTRLKTFASLLAQGLITKEEFEAEQRKLQGASAAVPCASCGATSPSTAERCFNCGVDMRPATPAHEGATPARSPAALSRWMRGPFYLLFVGIALLVAGMVIIVGLAWQVSSFDFTTYEYRSNALVDFLASLRGIAIPILVAGVLVTLTSTVWNGIERRRRGAELRAE